ncbi:MAG: CapA family protein [Candidatus Pacebacteria bacterium]|nr:CapA family protein [Candidatus Paceibacterota bacterium]
MNNPVNSKTKQTISLIFWIISAVVIGIIIASLFIKGGKYEASVSPKEKSATVIQIIPPIAPDPNIPQAQYFYVNKNENGQQPNVSAKAYLVGDLNTGEVILSKNQDEKFPMASVSKLMTALVATKILNPEDDTAQVTKTALIIEGKSEGKNGELYSGQQITINTLLYPLLLESSNGAAEVISEYFGKDDFISKMNQEAANLKMASTSYEDPSGLSVNNQSTPSDLFKLTGYIMQNYPSLFQLTTLRSYSNKKQSWSNISQFVGQNGYAGGKEGYTDAADQTVVAIFDLPLGQTGYRPIAITLLQSTDRKKDVETILQYLKNNIYYGGLADANTNWVQEKVGSPDITQPSYVTMAFAGDIMLDRGVKDSVIKNFNDDYSAIFENLNIFKQSDIAFANLEGPISDQGTNKNNLYSFRMDPAVAPALAGAGISILSVANNHIGDWGISAFTDTLSSLNENEIAYTGGGLTEAEADAPTIINKYGMKIGFLAFSDVGPNDMAAGVNTPGILLASDPNFDNIIKNAASQVDDLVVSFHFGDEYQTKHNARQEQLAHEAVNDGAKIVIGSHPHVVEDTEIYKNSYIAYSLGNLVFDQPFSANTMQGMLLEIQLNKDGSMIVKKDTTQLNSAFQIAKVTIGKPQKITFPVAKTN